MILVVITLKIDITYNETESISEGASVVITLKINITYNLEGQTQVEHINTNKRDNRVENLRWCSPKGNMANELTRYHLSIGHSNPSSETRRRMSEGQKKRFARERATRTGRYANQNRASV